MERFMDVKLNEMSAEELVRLRGQIDGALKQKEEENVQGDGGRNRLDRLNAYKGNAAALRQAEEQKKLSETENLIEKIKALKPRIEELLATANACLEAGIEVNAYGRSVYRDLDKYERGTFVTNGISHRVGFVQNWTTYDKGPHTFAEIGIDNGGACGCYDFRTDGSQVYYVHEKNRMDVRTPGIDDMKYFLRNFEGFESAFYAYVDKEIAKQEREVEKKLGVVGDVIAAATKRTERSGLSSDMAKQSTERGL